MKSYFRPWQAAEYGFVVLIAWAAACQGQVTTQAATGISSNSGSAVLHASVNPGGRQTGVLFEWGNTPSYGTTNIVADIGSGSVPVPVSVTIIGLSSLTNYHYRAVATNTAGVTLGNDVSFSTPFYPGGLSNPTIMGGNLEVTLNGTTNAQYGIYASTNLVSWSLVPPGLFTYLSARPFQVNVAAVTNIGHLFFLMR